MPFRGKCKIKCAVRASLPLYNEAISMSKDLFYVVPHSTQVVDRGAEPLRIDPNVGIETPLEFPPIGYVNSARGGLTYRPSYTTGPLYV